MALIPQSTELSPDEARILDLVRKRLEVSGVDEVIKSLRPALPASAARWREDGPPNAAWRKTEAPLLGLTHLGWEVLEDARRASICNALFKDLDTPQSLAQADLTGFGDWKLVHAAFALQSTEPSSCVDYDLLAAVLWIDDTVADHILFDWTGRPVMELVKRAEPQLADIASDYLRLFCALTGTEDGRFAIVERDDLHKGRDDCLPFPREGDGLALREILRTKSAPVWTAIMPNGCLQFEATVLYSRTLFTVEFEIGNAGQVTMNNDIQIFPPRETDEDA